MCIRDSYWDQYARGAIVGLTRGFNRAHLVRATLESLAYQTYDLCKAMESDADVYKRQHVARTVFPLPGEYGKGVLVAPTVHGNLILGPTAVDVENKEETCVRQEELDYLLDKVGHSVKNIPCLLYTSRCV